MGPSEGEGQNRTCFRLLCVGYPRHLRQIHFIHSTFIIAFAYYPLFMRFPSWLAGLPCTRYDQMAARTPKIAGNVEATQPVIDLARGADEGDKKDGGGDKVGKNGKGGEEEPGGREDKDFEGDAWEEGEVERGMLHALVELGNLEMLLHQVGGCWFWPRTVFVAKLLYSYTHTGPPPLLQHTKAESPCMVTDGSFSR